MKIGLRRHEMLNQSYVFFDSRSIPEASPQSFERSSAPNATDVSRHALGIACFGDEHMARGHRYRFDPRRSFLSSRIVNIRRLSIDDAQGFFPKKSLELFTAGEDRRSRNLRS